MKRNLSKNSSIKKKNRNPMPSKIQNKRISKGNCESGKDSAPAGQRGPQGEGKPRSKRSKERRKQFFAKRNKRRRRQPRQVECQELDEELIGDENWNSQSGEGTSASALNLEQPCTSGSLHFLQVIPAVAFTMSTTNWPISYNHEAPYDPEELRIRRPELGKYLTQKENGELFFNKEAKLDEDSLYQVTPERIAKRIATYCAKRHSGTVLDAFCGCGGNTIQFAKLFDKVIALDNDPLRIEYCQFNAKLYGVEDKIVFITGDFIEIAQFLNNKKIDMVFLSPPWDFEYYRNCKDFGEKYDIERIIPLGGPQLFQVAQRISENVAFYLPRNINDEQVKNLVPDALNHPPIFMKHFGGRRNRGLKAVTAYFGNLARPKGPLDDQYHDELNPPASPSA